MTRWWLRMLVLGAVLLHGAAACVDDSLNPQPLPPKDQRENGESNGGSTAGESPAPQRPDMSAANDGGASDGGSEGGDQ